MAVISMLSAQSVRPAAAGPAFGRVWLGPLGARTGHGADSIDREVLSLFTLFLQQRQLKRDPAHTSTLLARGTKEVQISGRKVA